jgi:hypothetical protein
MTGEMSMNPHEAKGVRAAIARLIEHLNRYPHDAELFVAGCFAFFILLIVVYAIGWNEGYGSGREAKNYPPPPGWGELQKNLKSLRR